MRIWVALLCLLLLPVHARGADWVRVETPHFVVFGQAGEKRTREVTAEFERFREAIGHVVPGAAVASPVPTLVVVFENQRAFAPYRPTYNGKPVPLGGFFTGTETDNVIALSLQDRDDALRLVLHEYTHLITANMSRGLPTWASEGLAEFYSTFAVAPDGKGAVLGRVILSHYALLSRSQLLSLEQLLTVDRSSALYNEGQRRSIFYAQSWAMVHMFLAGEPDRSAQFTQYLRLTAGGTPPLDAWKQAFGDFDAIKELKKYLARSSVRNFLYKFAEGIGRMEAQVSQPKAADVDAVLARLLRYGADEEVEPRLAKAVAMTPASSLARAFLGFTQTRARRPEEGAKLLLEAADDKSDWLVQYYVASGLTRQVRSRDDQHGPIALEAVNIVLAARPNLAQALILKARLQGGAEGAATAAKARALAPGREDYVILEAQLRADARDFATARGVLAPLMSTRFPPDVRDLARKVMGQIVRMEEFHNQRSRHAPPSTESSAPASPAGTDATPLYRVVGDGEQRVEGLLERIDCAGNGAVTLGVTVGGEQKRFAAKAFGEIEFITYRTDQHSAISCGVRTPADRVYVTWVALSPATQGVTGRPVAVEFLPAK